MNKQTKPLTNKELRNFGLMMAGFIGVLFGLFFPWVFERPIPNWPWIVAAIFVVPAIVYPRILEPVFHGWMKFGGVIGWVNTRIILAVVFYAVFTPYSVALKLLGKDPLSRKLDKASKSYRVESKNPIREHMERPF